MTDFLAAEAAANLLYTMAAAKGEEQTLAYLAKVHPKISPVRQIPRHTFPYGRPG